MARMISFKQAINEALDLEMRRDPSVIVMGEDIVGGAGSPGEADAWGGVLGVTKGLHAKHAGRLLDTPLSESAYCGAAIGAAACGMRPVAELMFLDFMGVCFDQILNQAAKFKYMFGGKADAWCRAMVRGFPRRRAAFADDAAIHPCRIKVVCPSNAYDAMGCSSSPSRRRPGDLLRAQASTGWRRMSQPGSTPSFAEASPARGRVTIVSYG
jgi:pyruvate dehydrogenase E1 component beta subunit